MVFAETIRWLPQISNKIFAVETIQGKKILKDGNYTGKYGSTRY